MREMGRAIRVYGPVTDVGAQEGQFVELVSYTVPVGRLLIADLSQAVELRGDGGQSLPPVIFPNAPVIWSAFISDSSGKTTSPLVLSPLGPFRWLSLTGEPIARAIVVKGGSRLIWGATIVRADEFPGELAGAITGLEVDTSAVDERTLLDLVARRC